MPAGEIKTYGLATVANRTLIDKAEKSDEIVLVPDFNEDRDYLWVKEGGLRAVEDNYD